MIVRRSNYSAQDSAFTALSVRKRINRKSNPHCRRQFSWDCGVTTKVLSSYEEDMDG